MRSFISWSQSLVNCFRPVHPKASRSSRPSVTRRSRRFESLEERQVFSATFGSAISLGGPEGDRVFDLKLDSDGNSYVTGYYSGTADFDQGATHPGDTDILTSKGGSDAFVAKYSPDNSLLWVRPLGGDAPRPEYATTITEAGRSLALAPNGDVIVTGEFFGRGSFGTTELISTNFETTGFSAGFVAKLTDDGEITWAKRLGESENEAARGVDVDAQGNLYTINYSFATQVTSIQKFNTFGQSLWNKSSVYAADVAVTASGSVYTVGNFKGKVDFDPGPKAKNVTAGTNNAAGYVLKFDTNGNFGWVTPFMGSGSASTMAVEVDANGNVFAGGTHTGSIDFDPSGRVTTLNSARGHFVSKLNSSGGLAWVRGLTSSGPSGSGSMFGLATDTAGNVYATGVYYDSIDLDPSAASSIHTTSGTSDGDIYVVKLSSSGNYVWGETFGGVGLDVGYGLALDSNGDVVLGGMFSEVVDFDPDPDPMSEYLLSAPNGRFEAFILRLKQA